VKPENILLDAELDPKITDFGLVKLLSRDACGRLVMSSRAQGTARGYTYTAPEWTAGLPITGKADVYSFGVVLLELLREREEEEVCSMDFRRLVAWIREKTTERDEELSSFAWLEEFVDRRLHGDFSRLQAAAMLELAVSCVDDDPVRRPNMNAVLQKLLSLEDAASMRYA
jgi:serine/threonine protein kinase